MTQDEMSPSERAMYEIVANSIRESLKDFVAQPFNRAKIVECARQVLAQQAERFGLGGGATHALVAPARAEGRPWLWGLPCMGSPEVPDDTVVLARFATATEPVAADTDTPGQVTIQVSFDVLRAWRVDWGSDGEPTAADVIRVREVEGP